MSKYEIELENVGCLSKATVSVEEEAINIKYGVNGIGKSTIIKGLKYFAGNLTDQEKKKAKETIISFDNPDKEPLWNNPSELGGILVYDRGYFNRLFTEKGRDDLLTNTYELIIKDSNYESRLSAVASYIQDLIAFVSRKEFDNTINLFTDTLKKLLNGKRNLNKVTADYFPSFTTDGIKLKTPPEGSPIFIYSGYMTSPNRYSWMKWLEDFNQESIVDGVCPYCGQSITKKQLQSNLRAIREYGSSEVIRKNNDEHALLDNIASHCGEDEKKQILAIKELDEIAKPETLKPVELAVPIKKPEIEKLQTIKSLTVVGMMNDFRESGRKVAALTTKLLNLKPNPNVLCVPDKDDSSKNLINDLNVLLDILSTKAKEISDSLIKLTQDVESKIKENRYTINNFLRIAGIPYEVKVKSVGDGSFNTELCPKGKERNIKDKLGYLSYGEANALALVLFAIEAKSSSSLIILDDPVSSFDSNKRYAIYDYLFGNTNSLLHGKTTLIMTHDFQTVVAFAKSNPLKNQNLSFAHLKYGDGTLIENEFKRENIESTVIWYKEYAKNNANPNIMSRLVATRRWVEIMKGKDDLFYNYLSGFIHLAEKPRKGEDPSSPVLTNDEISACDAELQEALADTSATYDTCLAQIRGFRKLYSLYKNVSSEDSFGKTCLVRPMIQLCHDHFPVAKHETDIDVATNFLNESFHPESNFIYSLKGSNSIEIPNYILVLCDDEVEKLNQLVSEGKLTPTIS